MRVVVAPDKFRGSATAQEVVAAACDAATLNGWDSTGVALADGGEGMLVALGGANRVSSITGPNGETIDAAWRLSGRTAVIEMALASGLDIAGGKEGNDPMAASTFGTGELLDQAVQRGAERIIVGLGGSATTDGGLGALQAMHPVYRFKGVELVVACDVTTLFVDAASVFGPQKGASSAQVAMLRRRLERLQDVYLDDYGVDVGSLPGAGAAGGLAGALAAVGATLVPGFELIAEELDLAGAIEGADLVITGEGLLDDQSFAGKVVGGVVDMAAEFGVSAMIVCGAAEVAAPDGVTLVSLSETYGSDRSWNETLPCVTDAVSAELARRRP